MGLPQLSLIMMVLRPEDIVANIPMNSRKNVANKNALIIFTKYPRPGFVKTRLGKAIGKKNAASLYKLFVETIVTSTQDYQFRRVIFFTPTNKKEKFVRWLGRDLEFIPQRGNDLGERMFNAFNHVFAQGAERVVIIGTDSPLIDNEVANEAFRRLKIRDCVIGPSLDGGYYLLGLSRIFREIFENIDWGTNKVFSQTLKAFKSANFKPSILKEDFDVDDIRSLALLNKRLEKELST